MKVSICMITYNHQDFLEQAINGVLMQKTDFDYELIIANDNSIDDSDIVIKQCIKSHANGYKIKYLNNITNLGMMPNFINALKHCTGNYIAMCEGDDYWIDENKLQKQADFLDKNIDFSMCFHKMKIKKDEVIKVDIISSNVDEVTTINDLAKGNYIHTCSVMYRNNLFDTFPDYFHKSPVGDYFLHLLNSQYGKIYYFNEVMAVYRIHETSYWSSKKQEERENIWIDFLQNIKGNFSESVQTQLDIQINKHLENKEELKKHNDLLLKIEIDKQIKKKMTFFKKLKNSIKKRINPKNK
jgi:glycosyltransferase involved in cell wall biosynthesis